MLLAYWDLRVGAAGARPILANPEGQIPSTLGLAESADEPAPSHPSQPGYFTELHARCAATDWDPCLQVIYGTCEGFNNFVLPSVLNFTGERWDSAKARIGDAALASLQTFREEVIHVHELAVQMSRIIKASEHVNVQSGSTDESQVYVCGGQSACGRECTVLAGFQKLRASVQTLPCKAPP